MIDPRDSSQPGFIFASRDRVNSRNAVPTANSARAGKSLRSLATMVAPFRGALEDAARHALSRDVLNEVRAWLPVQLTDDALAQSYAQFVLHSLLLARCSHRDSTQFDRNSAEKWLNSQIVNSASWLPPESTLQSLLPIFSKFVPPENRSSTRALNSDFYEALLASDGTRERALRGVYFTPPELVDYVLRSVETLRRKYFESDNVTVIDPAAGAGAFIAGSLDRLEPTRAIAFELNPRAIAIAHLSHTLSSRTRSIEWHLANALEQIETLAKVSRDVVIVVGNPPYSGHSSNSGAAIARLLRGIDDHSDQPTANYFQVDGVGIRERNPKWLNDDYIKFLRLSQWCVERAGRGIVALVCNHGFIDHPTFCGVRRGLMDSFDDVRVLDLHGNSKRLEASPDGSIDENVFAIQTGISVLLCVKTGKSQGCRVAHAEQWGSREAKISWLAQHGLDDTGWKPIEPNLPGYLFSPRDRSLESEYARGWKLTDALPMYSVGIVTGRDALVVDLDRARLLGRIEAIARGESPELRRGDRIDRTAIFAAISNESDLSQFVVECLYRPFDRRSLFYHEALIERSRRAVMEPMLAGENLALIARRQMLPGRECTYFGVTRHPIVDGVIRSDNHGSESIFTIYRFDRGVKISNFSAEFHAECQTHWSRDVTAIELASYIYGIFHSRSYRTRYAEFLRGDFPRVPITHDRTLADQICRIGQILISLHLLDAVQATSSLRGEGSSLVSRVELEGDRVWINAAQYFDCVDSASWRFMWGGYAPLQKWLKDRKGSYLSGADAMHYGQMVNAIDQTREQMGEIDRMIEIAGNFPLNLIK